MAKLLIDVKDRTKERIVKMAQAAKKTQKALILDALGIKDE